MRAVPRSGCFNMSNKGHQHEEEGRREVFEAVFSFSLVDRKITGHDENNREFHQFRRLKRKTAQGQPSLRPPGDFPGKKHGNEQNNRNAIDNVGVTDDIAVIQAEA